MLLGNVVGSPRITETQQLSEIKCVRLTPDDGWRATHVADVQVLVISAEL